MATISRFEDLIIWQVARAQCKSVDTLIKSGVFGRDFALIDQLNRSSGSVMDNIAEGFDRFTRADFRHFLIIARGSNAEVRSQFYRATDRNYLASELSAELIKKCTHLSVQITNLINHISGSDYTTKRGPQGTVSESEISYSDSDTYNIPDNAIMIS